MSDKLIKIAYLYEDLMNTYGDSGDVKILCFLLKREGYDTQVDNISLGDDFNAFDYDFVFFGGGQDFEQTVVAKDLPRHKETLEKYGFKIEADITSVSLHSIPNGLDENTATEIFHEIVDQLKEERIVTDEYLPEKIERALFTVACKAAIKGGRAYPPEFLDTVVKAVLSDPSIRFCPHGRPVAFEMSLTEIDARFKR